MIDDECGAVGGMRIGSGNRTTRRKPAPLPLCPPQIPQDLTRARTLAAAVGSQRPSAWTMARPSKVLTKGRLRIQGIRPARLRFVGKTDPYSPGWEPIRAVSRDTRMVNMLNTEYADHCHIFQSSKPWLRYSGMWRRVHWYTDINVSVEPVAFISRNKFCPEEGRRRFLQLSVPVYQIIRRQITEATMLMCTVVRISKLTQFFVVHVQTSHLQFSLYVLIFKNKRRLMRSSCCLSVCVCVCHA
jgi:hypothetical protein